MKITKVVAGILAILIILAGAYYFIHASKDVTVGTTSTSADTSLSTTSFTKNSEITKNQIATIDQSSLDAVSNFRTISGTANTNSVSVQIWTYNTIKGGPDGNATPEHWYEGKPSTFVPVIDGKWRITLPANLFPSSGCWYDQIQLSVGYNVASTSSPFKLCAK